MKKIVGFLPFFVASFGLFLISCEEEKEANLKHSTTFNMISSIENLSMVGSMDLLGILKKSEFESNPNLPMEASAGYKLMVKDKLDAELTGIELNGNNHYAISMNEAGEPKFVMFSAKVTNKEKIKKAIKDLNLINGKYTKEEIDGDEYEFLADDEVCVAWDDQDVVLVVSEEEDTKEIAKELLIARYKDAEDNEGLETYLKRVDDMNVYVNIEKSLEIAKNTKDGKEITDEMLEAAIGAYYVGSGNFNQGNIIFEANVYADKFKDSPFNALQSSSVSGSFLNYLTDDKLVAFGTASLNMHAIFDMLEMIPNNEFNFDEIAMATGLSRENWENLFSGEMAVSFVDMTTVSMATADDSQEYDEFFEDSYSDEKEMPIVIFTAGISDSSKLGNLLRSKGAPMTSNGIYKADDDAFIVLHEDKFIVTTDEVTATYFASGNIYSSYKLPKGADMTTPLFGYYNTDLQKMPDGVLKMAEDEEAQMFLEFADLFELVTFEGDFENMKFEAKLKNKSENALKVIVDFVLDRVKDQNFM